jgi:hypothetical protein
MVTKELGIIVKVNTALTNTKRPAKINEKIFLNTVIRISTFSELFREPVVGENRSIPVEKFTFELQVEFMESFSMIVGRAGCHR